MLNFLMDMQPSVILKCACIQFQELQTKMWLFDILVTPTFPYRVETKELNLNKGNNWKDLEEPLAPMIADRYPTALGAAQSQV